MMYAFSRRKLFALLFSAAAQPSPDKYRILQRKYRAQAVVLFCGVPVFSRNDVGGGYAVVEESLRGDLLTVALKFAGGSWPAKTHGLNRLGFIEEEVVEKPTGEPVDSKYFAFMTSSAEKNFEQAKKSFTESGGKPLPYTATKGSGLRSSLYRMFFPANITFADCPQLVQKVRAAVEASPGTPQNAVEDKGGAPNTFLNSVRQAMLNPAERTEAPLVYNGKCYRLFTGKQVEAHRTVRLSGTLEEEATRRRTPFRIWYEKDSDCFLPTRIEYKAKSFLRLVFEYDKENS